MNFKLHLHPRTPLQKRVWRFLNVGWFNWLNFVLALVYMALALIEEPSVWSVPGWVTVLVQTVCLVRFLQHQQQ